MLTLWTKDNLVSAIADIHWNIIRDKPSIFMLTACLVSIEKSSCDKEEISPSYPHNKERSLEIERLDRSDFINIINKLRKFTES